MKHTLEIPHNKYRHPLRQQRLQVVTVERYIWLQRLFSGPWALAPTREPRKKWNATTKSSRDQETELRAEDGPMHASAANSAQKD